MLQHVLDLVGFACALVLLLTAFRLFEVSGFAEVSARSLVAFVIGAGSAWSMAVAIGPQAMHPAHVVVLLGGALWVAQAIYRHRRSPVRHPGRRQTDFGELDSLASGGKKQ
jgi:hypothetical protein